MLHHPFFSFFVTGVVINDTPLLNTAAAGRPVPTANQGFGSVEVVTAEGHGQIGDVFDVTVTAKQNYGGQVTGQPFIIPGKFNFWLLMSKVLC